MSTRLDFKSFLFALLAAATLPVPASAQTAWFWAQERGPAYGLPSTLGICKKVATPRETIFGSVPNSGMVGEIAVVQGILAIGDLVPLPVYSDGSQATESEIFWTAQLWCAKFDIDRQLACVGNASAEFAGRRLTGARVGWGDGPAMDVKVLVNVVAVRPHDNRRVNR